jgi:hypothetical protein
MADPLAAWTLDAQETQEDDPLARWSVPANPYDTMGVMEKLGHTWPAKLGRAVAHSIGDAATLPGDVYTGKQDVNDETTIGRAGNFALLATPAAPNKLKWSKGPAKAPQSEAMRASGAAGYRAAEASNVALRGDVVSKWAQFRKADLQRKGFRDTNNNAPNTFGILDDLEKAGGTQGASLSAGDYINLRNALSMHAQDFANGKESAAATKLIKELDRLFDTTHTSSFVAGTPAEISGIRRTIKDARDNFAAAYRSDLVSKKDYNASLRSAAANSGRNYDNAARQRVADVTIAAKDAGGYNASEIAAMEKFVEGNGPRNFLRDASNRLGGGGGVGATVLGGVIGHTAGGGDLTSTLLGMGLPAAAGTGMKAAENALTKRDIKKLGNLIRLRSPMGKQAEAAQAKPPAQQLPLSAEEAYKLLLAYQLQNPDSL